MTTKNLWPEFQLENVLRTPKAILNEQAEFLAKGTKNLLTGNIKIYSIRPDEITYTFYIVAPNLGGYSYQLLSIEQKTISMYPCSLFDNNSRTRYEIDSEEKLLLILTKIFNSFETRNIIRSLISQSIDENTPSVQ